MIVYLLTVAQKNQLLGVEYIADCTYNPLEYANGNWIISQKEVEQTNDEKFAWVKDLLQIEYVKPKDNAS